MRKVAIGCSVNTAADLDLAIKYLYETMVASERGGNIVLYYGTVDGDFYELRNCWAPEHYKLNLTGQVTGDFRSYCQAAGTNQYLLVVRNDRALPTNQTYAYSINLDGYRGQLLTQRPSTSSVVSTSWFTQTADQWSLDFTYADGTVGSTYSGSILATDGRDLAHVAAEWSTRETPSGSCTDPCRANSVAVKSVETFAPVYINIEAAGGRTTSKVLTALYKTISQTDNGYASFLYFSDPAGNFWGIEDCYRKGLSSKNCISAGVNQRYLAYVRDVLAAATTPGVIDRNVFRYFDYGLGDKINTDVVNPGTQAWYTSAVAASPAGAGVWTGATVETYSRSMSSVGGNMIGVVGSDHLLDEPCFNGCKQNSAAWKSAHGVGGGTAAFANPISNLDEAKARLSTLAKIFITTDEDARGTSEVLFYFTPSGSEFFAIVSCMTPNSVLTKNCALAAHLGGGTGFSFIGQIKSSAAFADSRLHIFEVSPSGEVGNSLFNETSDFSLATFVYNRNVDGLSGAYTMPDNIGAMTFSRPIYSASTLLGNVGSAISLEGPCSNPAEANAFAVPITRSVGALPSFANPADTTCSLPPCPLTSLADVSNFVKQIFDVFVTAVGDVNSVRVMYPSSDYYGIVNCFTEQYTSQWCVAAGPSVRYIAMIRANMVFGTYLQYYALYTDGTLGQKITSGNTAFDATQDFVYNKEGWLSTGRGRFSYVLPVMSGDVVSKRIGVVASDRMLGQRGRSVWYSYAPNVAYTLAQGPLNSNSYTTITSNATVTMVLGALVSTLVAFDYGSNVGVSYAAITGDFYNVKDCYAAENRNNMFCVQAGPLTQFIVTVKNFAVFNNQLFNVFAANAAGRRLQFLGTDSAVVTDYALLSSLRFGVLTTASSKRFVATNVQNNVDINSNGQDLGYLSVPMAKTEPLYDICLANSWAPVAVHTFVSDQKDGGMSPLRFRGIDSFTSVELDLQSLLATMISNDHGFNVMLMVGFDNGDYYGTHCPSIAPVLIVVR